MDRRAVLGITGTGAAGSVTLAVLLLLLLLMGRCSVLTSFGKSGAVLHPRSSPSAVALATPYPSSSVPVTDSSATPVATATPSAAATATPTPARTPTPTPALTIAGLPVHDGEVGAGYAAATMTASGGRPPYTWVTNPGALPPGLSLSSGGVLSGTPGAAGTYTPTFRVDDSAGGSAGSAATFTIVPALAVTQPCVNVCHVEVGCTAACLAAGTQSGGQAPYSYSFSGTGPPGTSFANSLTLAGSAGIGIFAGPPPTYTFAITVGDSMGAPAQTATARLIVYGHVSVKGTSFRVAGANGGSSPPIPYTPGFGVPTAVVTGGPPGTKATVDGANQTVTIVVPAGSAPQAQPYNATLTLTDQAFCGPAAGQLCTSAAAVAITVF